MQEEHVNARGIRFSVGRRGVEIGHAYLYILTNEDHVGPFGLVEDVFVSESHRGDGTGRELLVAVIARAKVEKCYKLIATSRDDGTRQVVHEWYPRLGFQKYGVEFRMDL